MPKEPPEDRATVGQYDLQEVGDGSYNMCRGAERNLQYPRKFENGENVILKIKVRGVWMSYDFTVGSSRLGASNKPEYTLLQDDGSMYDGGTYFKEADLKSA